MDPKPGSPEHLKTKLIGDLLLQAALEEEYGDICARLKPKAGLTAREILDVLDTGNQKVKPV